MHQPGPIVKHDGFCFRSPYYQKLSTITAYKGGALPTMQSKNKVMLRRKDGMTFCYLVC